MYVGSLLLIPVISKFIIDYMIKSIMPNNKFTEDRIREAVKNSKSIAEMCRQLGMIPAGGNYASMKRRISRYDIDVSHFTGEGWNKENYLDIPNNKISIKKKLIRERGHKCEKCENTTWLEFPIMLELEHIDGSHANNDETNLLLLCPNCHAQTKTWRRPKLDMGKNPKLTCPICDGPKQYKSINCGECFQSGRDGRKQKLAENLRNNERERNVIENFCACGATITPRSKKCMKCTYLDRPTKIVWPPVDDLVTRLRDNKESYVTVGKSLGVDHKSVRRHLLRNNIDPKTFLPLA